MFPCYFDYVMKCKIVLWKFEILICKDTKKGMWVKFSVAKWLDEEGVTPLTYRSPFFFLGYCMRG